MISLLSLELRVTVAQYHLMYLIPLNCAFESWWNGTFCVMSCYSVSKSGLCHPMDCSMPVSPVLHCLKFMSIEQWCYITISSSAAPFSSCHRSFPACCVHFVHNIKSVLKTFQFLLPLGTSWQSSSWNLTFQCMGCGFNPCLFNLYSEYIMWDARQDETQAGIKIAGRNINNLRYADYSTLMA